MTLSFDIEAVPLDDTEPLLNDEGDDTRSFSPFTGRVVVISAWDDEAAAGVCLTHDVGGTVHANGYTHINFLSEKGMLEKWWSICSRQRRFATFFGNGYDNPFLLGRSVVNGVSVHRPLYLAKPWEDTHVDVCDRLKVGFKGRPTLDLVCRALGVPSPKGGIVGAQVAEAWATGQRVDVAEYCCRDVTALATVLAAYDASMGQRVSF